MRVIVLVILVSLLFYINFRIILCISTKAPTDILIEIALSWYINWGQWTSWQLKVERGKDGREQTETNAAQQKGN